MTKPTTVTKSQVIQALRTVRPDGEPEDVVALNLVQRVDTKNPDDAAAPVRVVIELKLPGSLSSQRESLRGAITAALETLDVQAQVQFSMQLTGEAHEPDEPKSNNPLPQVKHIVAVGAGKGGVGKSTIAINLAVGLARQGLKVGLLDGDIYGPSVPTMLGTDRHQVRTADNTLLPFELHGIKAMTIGALVEEDKPLIWRGPMAHGAFTQLVLQTQWGELDYLIVDLPPGTGDVPLTLAQTLPLTGAVVVCTPQKVAQDDARRAVAMFRQLRVEVLGLVENMSYFIGDDGKEYDLFGRGGAEMLATQMGMPYLGGVPINTNLRRNADAGDPTANFTNDDQLASELETVVQGLAAQVNVVAMEQSGPTLTIS